MWLTNDPATADTLRAIDAAYEVARRAAQSMPLAEAIVAYHKARVMRQAAYDAIGSKL